MSNIKRLVEQEQETPEYQAQQLCREYRKDNLCDERCEECRICLLIGNKVYYLNGLEQRRA